ncbi:MAG: DUF6305 family protein [Bacillota bacterium]|jgi:hypothetical protein
MMIKRVVALILFFLVLFSNYTIEAKKAIAPREPVLITPLGQNPDGLMIKVVLSKIGIKNDYLELASNEDLNNNDYHSLVMTVGVSYKGLGAIGINYHDEVDRARQLVGEAFKKDCPIILISFGENPGRKKRTNQLIKMIAPYSAYIISKAAGGKDKYFAAIAHDHQIPLIVVDNLAQLENIFKHIYCGKK